MTAKPKTPLPQAGGRYLREPDGTLRMAAAQAAPADAPETPETPNTEAETSSRRTKKPVKED